MNEPQTLVDRLWAAHEIARQEAGAALLWVDRHYIHEGSFHAFSQMKARGRTVAEPDLTFGFADHYVPTRAAAPTKLPILKSRTWCALSRAMRPRTTSRCLDCAIRAKASCMWSAPNRD